MYCFIEGDYVAVYWMENWVRAYIEWPDPSGERSVVRLLDYGGYWSVSNSECRPLILNYLSLPFQAIEVFLANIQPKNGNYMLMYNVYIFQIMVLYLSKLFRIHYILLYYLYR